MVPFHRPLLVGLLVLAAAASSGRAATAPTPAAPAVEDLVREALARNPSPAALRERIASAAQMVAPAGALPNPMTELMYTDATFPGWSVGTEPMSMVGVEVRQGLPYPGKREARREAARADIALREADLEMLKRQIARDVRVDYARLYAVDAELAVLEASKEMSDLLAETATARYSAGQGDQEAIVKARLLGVQIGAREADLTKERRATVAALGRLLDRPGALDLGRVTALPPAEFPDSDWDTQAIDASAEVAAKRAAVGAAEKRVTVARLDLKPDFSVAGSGSYRGSLDPVVTVRFGIEWPARRKQRELPLLRAAEAELEAARRDQQAAESAVREEVRSLAAMRDNAVAQLQRVREGIAPLSRTALAAARSQYLAGQGPFSTVIEDFNIWLDSQVETARRESELYQSWAELQVFLAPAPDVPTERSAR